MRRNSKIFVALLLLSGCSYDNRHNIAMGLIYTPPDQLGYSNADPPDAHSVDRAISGALMGRFPVNSSATNLRQFLVSLGAHCPEPERSPIKPDEFEGYTCLIPEQAGYCYGSERVVSVKTDGDKVVGILVHANAGGC
jgi:hypothetical protein